MKDAMNAAKVAANHYQTPGYFAERCSDLQPIRPTLARIAETVLPTAGTNDNRYFARVDVVPLHLSREDYVTIATALLDSGSPDALELFERLPGLIR